MAHNQTGTWRPPELLSRALQAPRSRALIRLSSPLATLRPTCRTSGTRSGPPMHLLPAPTRRTIAALSSCHGTFGEDMKGLYAAMLLHAVSCGQLMCHVPRRAAHETSEDTKPFGRRRWRWRWRKSRHALEQVLSRSVRKVGRGCLGGLNGMLPDQQRLILECDGDQQDQGERRED